MPRSLKILDKTVLVRLRIAIFVAENNRQSKGNGREEIVTSQLPVQKWWDYIKEPTLSDAIMDRLTANAHRVELEGPSLRHKLEK